MKSFNMEMENTPLFAMESISLSILVFTAKQRLLDQVHPSKWESKEHIVDRKTAELEKKLEVLDKRLRRGWQLISSKLPE